MAFSRLDMIKSISWFRFWPVAAIAIILAGCASHKPCSEAGDTSWPNPMRGDKVCYQRKDASGKVVNHGRYLQYYPNGKIFLEGAFKDGEKDGSWFQYNEDGKKILEKYFETGLERAPPMKASESDQGKPRHPYGSEK